MVKLGVDSRLHKICVFLTELISDLRLIAKNVEDKCGGDHKWRGRMRKKPLLLPYACLQI